MRGVIGVETISSLRARMIAHEDAPGRNPGESNWLNARLLLSDDGKTGMNVSAR